jgi:hypothetical protein
MTDAKVQAQLSAANLHVIESYKGGLYLPGIAELFGAAGQRLAARLESKIRGSRFDSLLWTQYYVVTRCMGYAVDAVA